MAEHPERLESAVVAYLQSLTTFSDNLLILAGESETDKDNAVILAHVEGDMGEEDPPFSNNRWCDFTIELRTPVILGDSETDWFAQHKANAAALENAILDDLFENSISNSSVFVYKALDRQPIREQTENYWMSGYRFRLYSCLQN